LNYAGKFDAALPHDSSGAPSHEYFHVDNPPAHAPADAIVVPDAHFLFNADFKRSGVDLILSGDNREVVFHDYFKGEKRAALASPDGAHLTGDIVNALTGHVEVSQAGTSAVVGQVIGHVTKLVGSATAIRNGVSIILTNGDNVEKGDVLQSGSDSTLGVTFMDGTVFGLSSNARMVLNEMVYDPNGSNNSSLMSLVAGTISFVAGQTAKHGDMKIDTPVATMGIRGTAVLVQIDFSVPGQSGAPNASFQVLVEPDGTTGSYILFDKTTLQPIAMVNQAGQQININNGVISQSNAPLSPDVQKLIQDVFTQKFTDNSNTKQTSPGNDSVTPLQQGPFIKLADGSTATPTFIIVNTADNSTKSSSNGPGTSLQHIPGPPRVNTFDLSGKVTTAFSLGELVGKTGDGQDIDSVSGSVGFLDVNAGDQPTTKVSFSTFSYQSAAHQDVTAGLSALQLADIAATAVKISVVPDAGNKNSGSATWTYSISDKAFDFLAAGEQLTLTYLVRVDNNYAPNNEFTEVPITITVTGTNDAPVITTSAQVISFQGGTSVPGGVLSGNDATSGTLAFQDADLTDTHTVSTELTSAVLDGGEVPPGPLALFEKALTASIETDSTGTGEGTVHWQLAELPVYLADFVPKGETLTLVYTVTVTDSQGETSSQTITVEITGTDTPAVVWIATASPGEASGGFWSNGSNWETGTVPTAQDDVIIITDQLIGLTPSFPVTIDIDALAKSVTMNDFGESPPELIVLSSGSLTIGTGGLNLSADSVLRNSGTITVAGKAEILDHSVVVNSGKLDLANGGDFADSSSITNLATGTIDVSGGTLDVLVDIANAGQIAVDLGAALALKGGTIDGGTLVIDGTLELEGLGVVKNGLLQSDGTIDVSGGGNEIDNEQVINLGALEVLAAGALLIGLGSDVANKNGTVTVDGAASLTVNDATISDGTVTNKSGGTIDLTGIAALKNGSLGNSGTINVSGAGNALDNENVNNTGNGAIDVTGALTLDQGTMITGGTLTIGMSGTLEVSTDFGATLSGVEIGSSGEVVVDAMSMLALSGSSITGGELTDYGTIHAHGVSAIDGVNIDIAGTGLVEAGEGAMLTIDNADADVGMTNHGVLEADGGEIDIVDEAVTNTGTMQATDSGLLKLESLTVTNDGGEVSAGLASTLDLVDAIIKGGTIDIAGTVDSTGSSEIDGAHIVNHGLLEVTGGTLTIDAASHIDNTGTIDVNGGTLIVDTALSGNAEIAGVSSVLELGSNASGAYAGVHVAFDEGATGILKIDHAQSFTGDVSGLDEDDTIDLADIAFGSNTKASYVGDANGGTLTVVNTDSPTKVAQIHLDGDYRGMAWNVSSDGHGGTDVMASSALAAPVILGETDPPAQTIVLHESVSVLAPGVITNSLGLPTETFNEVSAGSASNNGHGHGNFTSSALNAEFTASGNAGVTNGGSSGVSAPPFVGPGEGHQDTTNYLSIGANGSETITFATEQNTFGLDWGSVDSSNKIEFYNGDKLVASYTGADVAPLLASGDQGSFAANGYVEFKDLALFNKVVLSSSTNAFEVDNISAGRVSDIHLAEPITGTLTVSDNSIGETLTGLVTGPAVIEYNGSTKLPPGVNVDALIDANAVSFDSVKSDGSPDVLNWTYSPDQPNLDFLKPGDTLTITYHAQVTDGHGTSGDKALTITLHGTDSSVVNGTAQNDVFNHIGGGATILGHGGNDTFVFNANFGSATIGDFNVQNDTIVFDQAMFKDIGAVFANAQPTNFGLDTVITDANHDKLLLTGVTLTDLKAHPGDFHLV
jgi:fibronectin-binding autotransporter adhesin